MKSKKLIFNDQANYSSSKESNTLVENNSFKVIQRRWALVTIIIPTLGFVLAIAQLLFAGISFLEIELLVIMYALTIIGVELGFHRYFSHGAFQANIVIRVALAILGSMAAQGPPIHWVSNHRCHHQYSDRGGDPHSPYSSEEQHPGQWRKMWHAHMGWLLDSDLPNSILYAKDLLRDATIAKVNQLYLIWVLLGLVIPSVLGGILTGTWIGVCQGFLWGGLVRIFLVHHAVWGVNSFAHVYGSRPFDTADRSTNNMWLVLPSLGGAWHNNHHAFPTAAINGLHWWQIDPGGWVIWGLEKLGLAWNIKRPSEKLLEAKK